MFDPMGIVFYSGSRLATEKQEIPPRLARILFSGSEIRAIYEII